MGFFDNIFPKKSATPYSGVALPVILSSHGSSTDAIPADAMRITTVYSCVRLIADTIGTLPIHVKRRMPDGSRVTVYDHPVAKLLSRPNPYMGRIDLLRTMIGSEELHGNGYAVITERDSRGYPLRLDFVQANMVSIRAGENDIYYHIAGYAEDLPSRDVVHLKSYTREGIEGVSPISLLRDEIENCYNTTRYSKDLYKRDCSTFGVFSTDKSLGDDAADGLFKSLSKMLRRSRNTGAPVILEDGLKFSSMSMSPEDAQFVATKLQSIDQVAAAFRVPPHKVGDLTRGTYSNNEQGNIEFYIDCIRPKIEQFEEDLNRKLFLERERGEFYVEIDFRGLFRADTATRKDWYKELFYIGVFSPNEIRALEDMPAYEGGDAHYIPVNMTTDNQIGNGE